MWLTPPNKNGRVHRVTAYIFHKFLTTKIEEPKANLWFFKKKLKRYAIISNISLTTFCLYVFLQGSSTDETIFQETHEPDGHHTFASYKYYIPINSKYNKPLFLAIRTRTGHMKNGTKTKRGNKATQLTILKEQDTSWSFTLPMEILNNF